MAITTAISDLFSSIYELLASILGTFYAIIHSVITAILGLVQGFFTLITDVLGGVVDVTSGVGKFLASNIALIVVGAVIAVVYVRYTAQGQRVAAPRKTQ